MKREYTLGLKTTLMVLLLGCTSCMVREEESISETSIFPKYLAQIEEAPEPDSRTFANENLKVLWHAGDTVSIFPKNTYNQRYRFDGQDGANSGSFCAIPMSGYFTGNDLDYSYSVYPYQASTSISDEGIISLTLPSRQYFCEHSFGRGANTMVAVSDGNLLVYKNLGGYLMLKLYGEGISVSSITLRGNKSEPLAGRASVEMALGGLPSVELIPSSADTTVTLVCDPPVVLGTSADDYTEFWFVLPPLTFSDGIHITIKEGDGSFFDKKTSQSLTVDRSKRSRLQPLRVEPGTALPLPPNNEIWYTTEDGQKCELGKSFGGTINPNFKESDFGGSIISHTYENGIGRIVFDSNVIRLPWSSFFKAKLTSIELPQTLSVIDGFALFGNYKLKQITLPPALFKISQYAFTGCRSLKEITIPQSVEEIGGYPGNVFSDCDSLSAFHGKYASDDGKCLIVDNTLVGFAGYQVEHYTLSDDIESIQAGVFSGNLYLKEIHLPSGINSIGQEAFQYCRNLETVTFGQDLKVISRGAFAGCLKLSGVVLPDGLVTIGKEAFYQCESLSEITIPYSVSTIGASAFAECKNLSRFTGRFVTQDGRCLVCRDTLFAFAPFGCEQYTTPSGVRVIGINSFANAPLESLFISEGVTEICNYAVINCDSLLTLNLPATLTTIGAGFSHFHSLTTISFPQNISSIGRGFLELCPNLNRAEFKSIAPPVFISNSHPFFCKSEDFRIYVPATSVDAYKNADQWSLFADIILPE